MLTYSSQAGNSLAGTGWSLSGLSAITRCPSTIAQDGITRGVQDDAGDRFCLDGQRLIAVNGAYGADGTEYRTEIESFTRVISHGHVVIGNTTEPQWFEAWTKSGLHMEFGNTTDSRVTVSALTLGGPTPTIAWAVDKISDSAGNYLTVSYTDDPANGQFYPKEVDYTGNANASPALAPYNKVIFSYANRVVDPPAIYIAGHKSQITQRLTTITTYAGSTQARTYNLSYASQADFLGSVQECDGMGNCLNPTSFTWKYTASPTNIFGSPITLSGADLGKTWFASSGDVNGNGYDDLLTVTIGTDGKPHLILRLASGTSSIFQAPVDLTTAYGFTTSLRSCKYASDCAYPLSSSIPFPSTPPEIAILGDVNGDGRADLIFADGRVALSQGNGKFGTPYAANVQIGEAPFAVAKDVNGDGRADIVYGMAGSDGLTHYYVQYAGPPNQAGQVTFGAPKQIATAPLVPQYGITSNSDPGAAPAADVPCTATLGDVNGDGRADLVTCQGNVYLATDAGFSLSGTWMPPSQFTDSLQPIDTPAFLSAGDIKGNGYADILVTAETYYQKTGSISGNNYFQLSASQPYALSNGKDLTKWSVTAYPNSWAEWVSQAVTYPYSQSYEYAGPFVGWVAGNYSGHGVSDAVMFGLLGTPPPNGWGTYATVFGATLQIPVMINTITDGLGASRSIVYQTLASTTAYTPETNAVWPDRDLTRAVPLYVVSSTTASDGAGGGFTLNYSYQGGKANAYGRGFLGFHIVNVSDSQSGITTSTTYALDFPYTGDVLSVVKRTASLTLNDVNNTYTWLALPAAPPSSGSPSATCPAGSVCVLYPYLSESTTQSADLNGRVMPSVDTKFNNLDWYGNVGTVTVSTSDGYSKQTANTYTNDATHWILGRLTESQVTSTVPDGTGSWSLTRTSSFTYDSPTGFLTQETIEPNSPQYELITAYTYDTFGNRITKTVSGGSSTNNDAVAPRTTTYTYDSQGQFPIKVTNALSQSETRTYDPRFGTLTNLTGPNGLTTTWSYDGFGRKLKETRSDGTSTTWTYLACSSGTCSATASTGQTLSSTLSTAAYAVLIENTGTTSTSTVEASTAPVLTVYDELKRPVRTVTPSADGTQLVYQDTQYDPEGWVAQTSLPYFSGSSTIYWNQTTYDPLGRATVLTDAAGHQTTIAYDGLTTTTTNALQQKKTVVKNSLGQITSVTDAAGTTTTYGYDPFGDLMNVSNPSGLSRLVLYDQLGHKTLSYDPDAGDTHYNYDPLGELLGSTDNAGQHTSYTYDLLGRLRKRVEPDQTSYWVYDNPTDDGIGKLWYSYVNGTTAPATRFYGYDGFGRLSNIVSLYANGFQATSVTYDSAGRVLTRIYPDGFGMTNVYNAQGALSEVDPIVPSGSTFPNTYLWKAQAWDADGHVTQEEFGNGVTTTHTYDPATLREKGVTATATGGPSNGVENLAYTYDALGNTLTRLDTIAGTSEAFTYDSLNRLTQDACTGTCSSTVKVAYDALGDITSKSDVGTYTYGDGSHIHAVTQAGSNSYAYDADGNMTSGGGRTYTWMAAGLPASVTQNGETTSWSYDADYNRVTQTEPGKVTYFLNPRVDLGMHYEEVDYSGGRVDKIHTLYAGNEVIGQYTTTNQTGVPPSTTRYWSTDPLGSIVAMTDQNGNVADRYTYDPWGKQTATQGTTTDTDHGFTGQEELAVGLVQLNGRLYDPVIGRMVSVDPVIENAYDLQTYNGYSYVMNNPLGFADPSGLCRWGCFWQPKHWGPVGRAVFVIAVAYVTDGLLSDYGIPAYLAAPASGAAAGYAATGTPQGALNGAITAEAFYAVGSLNQAAGWDPGSPQATFDHALVGGATSSLSGGSFKEGFLSAGFAEYAGPHLGSYDNVFTEATVGGTASVLGGGKFENGAITAAFAYEYNDISHMLAGTDAHRALLAYLKSEDPSWTGNTTYDALFGTGRPDLIYPSDPLSAYEIKADGSDAAGAAQLQRYLNTADGAAMAGSFLRIFRGAPSLTLESGWFPMRTTYTYSPGLYPGVVTYTIDRPSVLQEIYSVFQQKPRGAPMPLPLPAFAP